MGAREQFDQIKKAGWPGIERWPSESLSESVTLEFKRTDFDGSARQLGESDRKSLARTISGFANTDGGVLVFGVEASRGPDKKAPDVVQAIRPIPAVAAFSDLVKAAVRDLVEPTVASIDVEIVRATHTPETGVLVILIPRSQGGPHRARGSVAEVNDRYFMRTADSTTPMPHRLLAALFAAPTSPALALVVWQPANGADVIVMLWNRGPGCVQRVRVKAWLSLDGVISRGWREKGTRWEGGGGSLVMGSSQLMYPDDLWRVGSLSWPEVSPLRKWFTGRVDSPVTGPLVLDGQPVVSGEVVRASSDGVELLTAGDHAVMEFLTDAKP